MKRLVFLLFFFLYFFYSDAAEALKEFQNKYGRCEAIEGSFTQKTYISGDFSPQVFEGKITIVKPDKIRIEYTSPISQIIYVEGEKTVIYSPEEQQAIISKLDKSFLVGKIFKNLAENRSLSSVFKDLREKEDNNKKVIILKSDDKQVREIFITLSKDNNLSEIQIIDSNNNKVDITFSSFKCLDKKIDITLKLPKNVEIINY